MIAVLKFILCFRTITPLVVDQNYINLKNQVIKAERRVLKELGFCVHVKHPHKVVIILLIILFAIKIFYANTYGHFIHTGFRRFQSTQTVPISARLQRCYCRLIIKSINMLFWFFLSDYCDVPPSIGVWTESTLGAICLVGTLLSIS